jgi:hypothetical protein
LVLVLGAMLATAPDAHAAQAATRWLHFRKAGWTLIVVQNAFSDQTVCRLRGYRGRAAYINGAFAFDLSEPAFIGNATARIDGGDPVVLRDEIPALMARGVVVDAIRVDGLGNDRVWITEERVGDGRQIVLQPRIGGWLSRYNLQGYTALRATAEHAGCTDEAQFR